MSRDLVPPRGLPAKHRDRRGSNRPFATWLDSRNGVDIFFAEVKGQDK